MRIYVETNFLLELIFAQEERVACEGILQLAEAAEAELVLPAFCWFEALDTFNRQKELRFMFPKGLDEQIQQLKRTSPPPEVLREAEKAISFLKRLLTTESDDSERRFEPCFNRVAAVSRTISLSPETIFEARRMVTDFKLKLPDAVVLSLVLGDCAVQASGPSCFVSRDQKAFDNASVKTELKKWNCKVFKSFEDCRQFLIHTSNTETSQPRLAEEGEQ